MKHVERTSGLSGYRVGVKWVQQTKLYEVCSKFGVQYGQTTFYSCDLGLDPQNEQICMLQCLQTDGSSKLLNGLLWVLPEDKVVSLCVGYELDIPCLFCIASIEHLW